MNETLITDLVSQQAIDQLDQLDRKMEGTLRQFQQCAVELARGIKIPVEVTGDLERLQQLYNTQMRNAQQATQQLTQQLQQQQQVVANTTNTISRQLMEQEKLNKANREAFTQNQEALRIAEQIVGTYEENTRQLARYTAELARNKAQLKEVENQRKSGLITDAQALQRSADLMAEQNKLKAAMQEVASVVRAQAKEMNAAEGSYVQLSQQLEILKKAQKGLNEEEKAGAEGKMLEKEIQNLDARLKDLAADMGEFQRNVGNYAVAANNMKGTLRELTEEIAQLTLQYEELSDEDKRGDIGAQLRDKITQLTEEAGKYKDIVSDVKQSISASASDTRLFDSLIEAGQVFAATMGVAETACRALGMSEDSLQQSMLKVQQAMQAVQALQVIQNTLQKQSNLMKGIAILQSKAAAAAARMEAAATAQATGATVAQTVAQKAFNAVAKANPYVLLATAILAVIGLIVAYTSATNKSTEADEAAAAAAKRRKESTERLYDSVANSVGELTAKYQYLRAEWRAAGDDIKAKEGILKKHKSDFDQLSEAVYGSSGAIKTVNDVEKVYAMNEAKFMETINRRAWIMGLYAEKIRLAQEEARLLLEQENATVKWAVWKPGERATYRELKAAGAMTPQTEKELEQKIKQGYGENADDFYHNNITHWQAWKLTQYEKEQAFKKREEKYGAQIQELEDRQNKLDEKLKEELAKQPKEQFYDLSDTGGGTTGARTTTGTTDAKKEVKEINDVIEEVNKLILDSMKNADLLEEKYTDEWIKKRKDLITEQLAADKAANDKRKEQMLEDLDASYKAKLGEGYESEKEYQDQLFYIKEAHKDIELQLEKKAANDEKAIDDEVTQYKESEANKRVTAIANAAAAEQVILDNLYNDKIIKLNEEYEAELEAAVKRGEDTTKITERYNRRKAGLDNEYADATVKAQIDAIKKELAVEDISEEERVRLQEELTKATADLARQRSEVEQKFTEETVKNEEEARKKRQESLQSWVQKAGEAVQKIGDFVGALYDNQISKIEEALEVEQERYDKEVEHIDDLAERGAITTEEAELRKREAAAATAARQEQLEKKKASMEYKKAVIEKANSIAQIGIATALGIMQTYAQLGWPAGIPGAIFIGAMGAIQAATALAQPIKAYAEGTKGKPHPGGLALVGEAGSQELVMYDGKAWVTPDKPTLLDLPRGAEVFPDATPKDLLSLGASLPMSLPRDRRTGQPVIINDYSALESRVATNTKAVTKTLNQFSDRMAREMKRQKFNAYIASRI